MDVLLCNGIAFCLCSEGFCVMALHPMVVPNAGASPAGILWREDAWVLSYLLTPVLSLGRFFLPVRCRTETEIST